MKSWGYVVALNQYWINEIKELEAEELAIKRAAEQEAVDAELEAARLEEEARIAAAAAARRASIDEIKVSNKAYEQFDDQIPKQRKSTFNDSGGSYTGDDLSDVEDIDEGSNLLTCWFQSLLVLSPLYWQAYWNHNANRPLTHNLSIPYW